MDRRQFLVSIGAIGLTGCAGAVLIGSTSYYYREPLAQYYCNLIGCEDGEIKESELEKHVRKKTQKAADLAVSLGMEVSPEDIEVQYEEELVLAKRSLRRVGIKLID